MFTCYNAAKVPHYKIIWGSRYMVDIPIILIIYNGESIYIYIYNPHYIVHSLLYNPNPHSY